MEVKNMSEDKENDECANCGTIKTLENSLDDCFKMIEESKSKINEIMEKNKILQKEHEENQKKIMEIQSIIKNELYIDGNYNLKATIKLNNLVNQK